VEGGDNTINAAEAAGGIVITAPRKRAPTVTVNGVAAIVAANGTYTATIPAPGRGHGWPAHGHRQQHGCGGNTATDTRTLTIDRGTAVTITGVEGGGLTTADTTINAAEARDGIVITGPG
jgi:hypothetical protein